jgi:flavin-dependent dehydrogenase
VSAHPRLLDARGRTVQFQADHVLLATGAGAGPIEAAGMCTRRVASGVGLRAYFELPPALARELDVFSLTYDRPLCPGYGWVFPGPDGIFNGGVGFFHDSLRNSARLNLRELWGWFMHACRASAQIRKFGHQRTALRGAPLRTSLRGAAITRPGLMLVWRPVAAPLGGWLAHWAGPQAVCLAGAGVATAGVAVALMQKQ